MRMPTDAQGEAMAALAALLSYQAARVSLRACVKAGWVDRDEKYHAYSLTLSGYSALIRWLTAKRDAIEREQRK